MRRIKEVMVIVVVLIVLAFCCDAFGVVTASTTLDVSPAGAIRPVKKTRWVDNITDTSINPFEIIKAAPGSGKRLYLEYVVINCASPTTVTIRNGTTTAMLGPYEFSLTGSHFVTLDFRPDGLQLGENQALAFATAASATVTITAKGYTAAN